MRTIKFISAIHLALTSASLGASAQTTFNPPKDPTLEHILSDWRNPQSKHPYSFPNDLTRDITPIGVHSHNDFWRTVPLFSALSFGAISVEADVFYYNLKSSSNANLYIGHDPAALDPSRTLKSLYLDPLKYVLGRMNPTTGFNTPQPFFLHGVYSNDVLQTLYLFIDFHSSLTSPGVKETLLREINEIVKLNYTSSVSKDTVTGKLLFNSGPITIVFTGANGGQDSWDPAPKTDKLSEARHWFYDGDLIQLGKDGGNNDKLTNEYSVIASGDFMDGIGGSDSFKPSGDVFLTKEQKDRLSKQIAGAHAKGMLVRYWNTPSWPARVRRGVWRELVELGVDLLNVDELEEARKGVW